MFLLSLCFSPLLIVCDCALQGTAFETQIEATSPTDRRVFVADLGIAVTVIRVSSSVSLYNLEISLPVSFDFSAVTGVFGTGCAKCGNGVVIGPFDPTQQVNNVPSSVTTDCELSDADIASKGKRCDRFFL